MSQKIAFLFPGQGSQYVGMGYDMMNAFPEAKALFKLADDICQKPISRLCFEGPLEDLTLTVNLQPAVTTVSLACLAALSRSGVQPMVAGGHSLGEYAALAAAGVISNRDALALVNKRGELMHRESLEHPGAMAAIIGMSMGDVKEIVDEVRGKDILGIANHNTAEQIVITGQKDPVSRAMTRVKEKKCKAIPLKVSGAWHCGLMDKAVRDFREFMEDIPFSAPKMSVLFNATAEEEINPTKIKNIMAQQLVSPVKWYDIILKMLDEGVDLFVEVGPKNILTGLVKKIVSPQQDISIHNIEDVKGLRALLEVVA